MVLSLKRNKSSLQSKTRNLRDLKDLKENNVNEIQNITKDEFMILKNILTFLIFMFLNFIKINNAFI